MLDVPIPSTTVDLSAKTPAVPVPSRFHVCCRDGARRPEPVTVEVTGVDRRELACDWKVDYLGGAAYAVSASLPHAFAGMLALRDGDRKVFAIVGLGEHASAQYSGGRTMVVGASEAPPQAPAKKPSEIVRFFFDRWLTRFTATRSEVMIATLCRCLEDPEYLRQMESRYELEERRISEALTAEEEERTRRAIAAADAWLDAQAKLNEAYLPGLLLQSRGLEEESDDAPD
jgi:hypothetical protein